MNLKRIPIILVLSLIAVSACKVNLSPPRGEDMAIKPSMEHPFYWQFKGEPVLLIGGSDDDNLFQFPDLVEHLDEMKMAGANYIRNTMSDRDKGNLKAYQMIEGKYDLEQWNEPYWEKYSQLLAETEKRDIIVQIEVWDSWDFYRGNNQWAKHPFNPAMNSSYTAEESGLPEEVNDLPYEVVQPFFYSVPELENNEALLPYQQAYVDKMLSYSLQYDHVLYSMNNETCADKRWGQYWAGYIRARAEEAGKTVYLTDMFDSWDPTDGMVEAAMVQDSNHHPGHSYYTVATPSNTYNHPEIYDFVDISNHNVQVGETHYLTARYVLDKIEESGIIRPVTCVKIYGGPLETFWDGTRIDGQERFWRNFFAGISAARFHRPRTGIGLSDTARLHIRSMRMLSEEVGIWDFNPDNSLLDERDANEAFCLADREDGQYCIYFPRGGEISLEVTGSDNQGTIRWLNILECKWTDGKISGSGDRIAVKSPTDSHWVALVKL